MDETHAPHRSPGGTSESATDPATRFTPIYYRVAGDPLLYPLAPGAALPPEAIEVYQNSGAALSANGQTIPHGIMVSRIA